ncbi:high choriolytic enzyme 1-like protein [Lates japonicus]|uniref:High choriolytic enzyme 1-like protein n=1 Tax=Lates japonicus TaxID=270547 RepID=A0AAD3R5F0_LATJO|nr:high choriolytic enzyme 1-like protein [Lates japonicus]
MKSFPQQYLHPLRLHRTVVRLHQHRTEADVSPSGQRRGRADRCRSLNRQGCLYHRIIIQSTQINPRLGFQHESRSRGPRLLRQINWENITHRWPTTLQAVYQQPSTPPRLPSIMHHGRTAFSIQCTEWKPSPHPRTPTPDRARGHTQRGHKDPARNCIDQLQGVTPQQFPQKHHSLQTDPEDDSPTALLLLPYWPLSGFILSRRKESRRHRPTSPTRILTSNNATNRSHKETHSS